jgi:hypothetical protein
MSSGIIKVMSPKGDILSRFWITNGQDRGQQPNGGFKWDFDGMDEHESPLLIQIQLTTIPGQEATDDQLKRAGMREVVEWLELYATWGGRVPLSLVLDDMRVHSPYGKLGRKEVP